MEIEEVCVEPKTRLLAVVQVRKEGHNNGWKDAGQVGDVTEETFESVARRYLNSFRKAHPYLPKEWSQIVRRTQVTTDEPMEW